MNFSFDAKEAGSNLIEKQFARDTFRVTFSEITREIAGVKKSVLCSKLPLSLYALSLSVSISLPGVHARARASTGGFIKLIMDRIPREWNTIDVRTLNDVTLKLGGRHHGCSHASRFHPSRA